MYQVFINAYADPLASSAPGRKMLNEKMFWLLVLVVYHKLWYINAHNTMMCSVKSQLRHVKLRSVERLRIR